MTDTSNTAGWTCALAEYYLKFTAGELHWRSLDNNLGATRPSCSGFEFRLRQHSVQAGKRDLPFPILQVAHIPCPFLTLRRPCAILACFQHSNCNPNAARPSKSSDALRSFF
jgi:hypothetical protein